LSIYPDRKGGELTGRFCVEVQQDGKRLRGRRNTLAEAKVLEQELLARFASGEPVEATRKFTKAHSKPLTLSEAISSCGGKIWAGLASEDNNLSKLNTFLSVVGNKPLDSIGVHDIDSLVSHLEDEGRADATINRYQSAVNMFLNWCKSRGYRTKETPPLDWREESEGRIRWLSYQEEALMLQHARFNIPKVIKVAIETGLRASELLCLEEKGDLAPEWIHLWKTKNKSARSIPISGETYALIKDLLDEGMPSYATLRYEWDRAAAKIGLDRDPEFVFHTCRHTYATRLVEANVNLRVIQTLMGHKRIETTMRYAHVHDATLIAAADLARAFHNGRRSVAGSIQLHTSVGLASVREGAKGPPSTDRKDTEVRGCDGAGVAELVDALVLGSNEDLIKT
jgi:integrase